MTCRVLGQAIAPVQYTLHFTATYSLLLDHMLAPFYYDITNYNQLPEKTRPLQPWKPSSGGCAGLIDRNRVPDGENVPSASQKATPAVLQ